MLHEKLMQDFDCAIAQNFAYFGLSLNVRFKVSIKFFKPSCKKKFNDMGGGGLFFFIYLRFTVPNKEVAVV